MEGKGQRVPTQSGITAGMRALGKRARLVGIGLALTGVLFGEGTTLQEIQVEHQLNIDVAPRRGGIIAVGPDGRELYKINGNQATGYHLSVWDSETGALIREIVPKTKLDFLRDIDLSPDGSEIYAVEFRRGYVRVISSSNGRILRSWKVEGFREDGSVRAVSLAVSTDGKEVYVNLIGAEEVQVFSRTGKLLRRFPAPRPHEIDVSHDGRELFVANLNNQIDVYNPNGVHLRKFGEDCKPLGVEVARDGLVFVTAGDWVCMFSRDGDLLAKFGEAGSGDTQFNMALTSASYEEILFVCDDRPRNREEGNHRIQKFRVIRPSQRPAQPHSLPVDGFLNDLLR